MRVRARFSTGQLTTPKFGKVRAVALPPAVASALAPLSRRADRVGDDDLVAEAFEVEGTPARAAKNPR